ncbi:MAG: hypothetical protein M3Z85_12175, partial [Acidobacteriota bacterium]|nr:hypothetical protein [Acidobacteriota bacterium]
IMFIHRNCALIFLNLGLAAIGLATPTPGLSLEDLVIRSETIVSGRVVRSWPAWDRSHQFIWTHYEVAVQDVAKGLPVKNLVVSEPGGTVDGITMLIPGTVQFPEGRDLLLFLYKTPIGYLRTVGGEQGRFLPGINGSTDGPSARELKQKIALLLNRKRENSK